MNAQMILYERRLRGREKRERETERGQAVGLSYAGQGGGVGGWGVANWFHWILAWWPHLPTMTSCHMYARNRVKSSALHPVLYCTGWPFVCVRVWVCMCVCRAWERAMIIEPRRNKSKFYYFRFVFVFFLCIFARLAFFFLSVSLCASCFLFMTNLTICLSCCVFGVVSRQHTTQQHEIMSCL